MLDYLKISSSKQLSQEYLRKVQKHLKVNVESLNNQSNIDKYWLMYFDDTLKGIVDRTKWHNEEKVFYIWITLTYCQKYHPQSLLPNYYILCEIAEKLGTDRENLLKKWMNLLRSQARNKKWNADEEEIILNMQRHFLKLYLSLRNQPNNWTSVCLELGKKGYQLMNPKEIRERWNNHLNPDLSKEEWSVEEDLELIKKIKSLNNSWSEMSCFLVGRNQNQIKNRYHELMRKYKTIKKCLIKLEELKSQSESQFNSHKQQKNEVIQTQVSLDSKKSESLKLENEEECDKILDLDLEKSEENSIIRTDATNYSSFSQSDYYRQIVELSDLIIKSEIDIRKKQQVCE